jgi:hypothetical protein
MLKNIVKKIKFSKIKNNINFSNSLKVMKFEKYEKTFENFFNETRNMKVLFLLFIATATIEYNRRKRYFAEEKRKEQPTVITGNIGHCAVVTIHLKRPSKFVDCVKEASKLQEIVSKINNDPEKLIAGVGFSTNIYEKCLKDKNMKVPEG